ncbi:MAG: RNA polymerase sigma factor [Acidimicrobiales bacterium]
MSDRTPDGDGELDRWMAKWYVPAYRSACLVLGSASEAEEAVQEAFLRMWRFRAAMPSGDAARPWLFRVVMNSCYSHARKEQRAKRHRDGGAHEADIVDPARRPDDLAVADETAHAVREALERLPEQLRIPVVLRYYAGLSEKEIALAIHRRAGTVKSRLHDARRLLGADPSLLHLVEPIEDSK